MKRLIPIVLLFALVGCGGDSSPSVAPSPVPAPAPQPAPPPPTPFQGVWIGTWTKQQCTETAAATGSCAQWPTSGGFTLTLTQSGSAAQGTLSLGLFQLNVSGPISAAGELTLSGNGAQSGATVNLSSWRTSISGNAMLGSFLYSVLPDDVRLGTITVTAGLQSVVKQ